MSTVTATVKVVLRLKVDSTWGDECSVGQVKKQAMDSANGMINKALDNDSGIEVAGHTECVNISFSA